jgi:iron complex transport system permease protein
MLILLFGASIGSMQISSQEILVILGHKLFSLTLPESIEPITVSVFWNIRFPRVLATFLVGAALGVTGTVMQSVLRNPLASSYTLGVSSGASLGVAILVVFGINIPIIGSFSLPLVGFIFGLGTVFIAITSASKLDRNLQNQTIILVGMVLSLFVSSLLTIIIAFSKEHLQQLIFWQMGSFSAISWFNVFVLFVIIIPGILFLISYGQEMDIMTFGEEQALSIGIELKKVKLILIAVSALLTGTAVSFVGIIGFIDLIAPHVVRKIFGTGHKIVIPLSALFGGAFMTIADLISRTVVSPSELPVGAVTALIGAPFFAYVFFYRKGVSSKNA